MDASRRTTRSGSSDGPALAILRGLVLIAMFVSAAFAVASLVAAFTSDSLVAPMELSASPGDVTTNYPEQASVAEVNLLVDLETGLGYRIMWWLVTDALAFLALAFLEIVRRMLAKGAEPFTEENASRLRWLIRLAIAFAVADLLRSFALIILQDNHGFEDLESVLDFSSLFVALALAALLEIWRHGVALHTDQELTI